MNVLLLNTDGNVVGSPAWIAVLGDGGSGEKNQACSKAGRRGQWEKKKKETEREEGQILEEAGQEEI